jgi:aminoglycoside phosphotransferase (APT) family kinase protein
VEEAIAAYLGPRLEAKGPVRISHLLRIPGGASRETWMFKAAWETEAGRQSQEFVLRKDPPASLLETDREAEFAFYSAFRGTKVPVPVMRWLERDASILGGPFFVMERIKGGQTNQRAVLEPRYQAVAGTIADNMYRILAEIAQFDWTGSDIPRVSPVPTPETAWKVQLDHWERVIDENELSPQPITRAAIRWLRANPPPPAQRISVVHGDYRVGNVIYTPEGEIIGVLDWEMAHLGDPLEDLAWSLNESWQWARDGRAGGIVAPADAIAAWERHSGLRADPHAVHWWWLFNDVKCQAIWLTGARSFQEGRSRELILAIVAYTLINGQDQAMLRTMGRWRA